MRYRELLELYKNSELDENRKLEVEADIEKQEAIGDYLYEKAEIPGLKESFDQNMLSLEEGDSQPNKASEFSKIVNRSIRKAFFKMGIATFCVVLAAILFIQFALPKLVSSLYYNPAREIAENTNQISLDMSVYTELAIPGYYRDNITVNEKGYGNYDIYIYQNVSYNGAFTNLSGKIEKGKLTLYDMNVLKRPTGNIFGWYQIQGGKSDSLKELLSKGQKNYSMTGGTSQTKERVQNLSENTMYIAYVTLDRMMNFRDAMNFMGDNDVISAWCAVCTKGNDASFAPKYDNLGFVNTLISSITLNWDEKKYPNLVLYDMPTVRINDKEYITQDETFMKTHFMSMLRYMSKQDKFLSMMNAKTDTFSAAAEYVEKNGITIYGFAFLSEKDTLLALSEKEEVYGIYTEPLK